MRDALLIAIGNIGRFLYEWADHKLEAGDHDVVAHAEVRFTPTLAPMKRKLEDL